MKSRHFISSATTSGASGGSNTINGRFLNLKASALGAALALPKQRRDIAPIVADNVAVQLLEDDGAPQAVGNVEDDGSAAQQCPICLSDFENASSMDGCSHKFCWLCITQWAKIDVRCPMCKANFSIVQSMTVGKMLAHFEPPLEDSEDDEEDDEDDNEDLDEDQEGAEEEGKEREEGIDGYESDDGFVCANDEVEYESDAAEALPDEGIPELESDSEEEERKKRKRRRKPPEEECTVPAPSFPGFEAFSYK